MQDAETRSKELFKSGYLCAESVLMAVAEHQGIQSPLIPRIATGFCGGMSLTSGLCGALNGGILALNLLYGRTSNEESRDKNYAVVAKFIEAFEDRFGTARCSDLLGCDLSTEEGYRFFNDENLIEKVCAKVTGEATGLVMELIGEETPTT